MKKIINELEIVHKELKKSIEDKTVVPISIENILVVPTNMYKTYVDINKIIDTYLLLENTEKVNIKVSYDVAWLLLGFGFYMATYALRLSEQRYFNNGLVAIGIASKTVDLRDALRLLALYWDVHKKTNLSFEFVLSQNNEFSKVLQRFIERKESDKSLDCMGFEIIGKGENIQFAQKN